ncbi:hypothetical protein [Actinoplanes aureus]|uniref:Uncharacterized protein n=1 Tax=Actinoplanes aureus TaxID=2792083 RepID=A0A931CML7_9ACTN|nr:hypothetical protein [Actinoplanes aureus]MBG0569171.1 hypothetical protein [Actinoplanes aureus]
MLRHPSRTASAAPCSSGLEDLPDAVITASQLIRAGDTGAAAALLQQHLHDLDFAWLPHDPVLIDACTLYATVTTGTVQLDAAGYAYRASRRLHYPDHPRRLAATQAYGTALHHNDQPGHAVNVRRDRLHTYRTLGRTHDALTTAADLAISLHAGGHCTDAIGTIADAWQTWRHHATRDLATGTRLLRTYLLILRGCRYDLDVITLLHQAHHTGTLHALATTRTDDTIQEESDYVTRHCGTVCTQPPQHPSPTGAPGHDDGQPTAAAPASPDPTAGPVPDNIGNLLRDVPGRDAGPADHRTTALRHPFTGYHQQDIGSALARLLAAPGAMPLLDPAGTDPGTKAAARRSVISFIAAHLGHRRGRRAALRTAAVLLPALILLCLIA